jgi:hypothetical protein
MSSDLRLDWATHAAAEFACRHWHYSGCMPAGKTVKIGAWEAGRYIGAVIFGRGASGLLLRPYGLQQTEGCELTRVALTAHRTPVSRIVAIAIRFLHRQSPGMRLIVSFADPEQGHHGGIYQAGGWIYTGTVETHVYVVHGAQVHPKSLHSRYGIGGQSLVWLRANVDPAAERVIGFKHRYLFPLDAELRERVAPLAQPYPKRPKQAMTGHHPEQRRSDTDPDAPSIPRRATRGRPRRRRATVRRAPRAA